MGRALLFASISLALGAFASACGNECSRVGDCPTGEVCRQGVCTAGQAGYLTCASNLDCNSDGAVFVCRAGRCTLAEGLLDSGTTLPDVGTSSLTDVGP